MLSISRSHYSRPMQFAFLLSNGIGIGLAIVYNINTPDLYPNNSHHKLGWFVTWLCVAQVTLSLILKYPKRNISYAFTPVSQEAMAEHQRNPMSREECQCFSHVDSGHGTETSTSIQSRSSASFSSEDVQLLSPQQLSEETEEEKQVSMKRKRWGWTTRFTFRMLSHRFPQLLGHMYDAVDRLILLLGFVAISTGWITYGGLFKGAALFSGLAHFIKGGVFFWFGILTLGRWAGCFAEIGWAWNIKSARNNHPTAEFVESFLLFFYGFTNVFMEHLAAWGAAWSAQDLEHISLTVMFFGGGLVRYPTIHYHFSLSLREKLTDLQQCGMLIESATLRAILNERNTSPKSEIYRTIMASHETDEPPSYQISINPLPALIIILLGKMMSSHQQETMVSTMLHSLWGSLLMAAAFARLATYLLLYLSPPRSIFPGRPPTELLAAFCFMAGGLLFMCSVSSSQVVSV